MDDYKEQDLRGLIDYVDQPADMVAMYEHVDKNIGRILRDCKDKQFMLIKFMQPAREDQKLVLPERPDWFSAHNRKKLDATNTWHIHDGVAIFSPEQEASIPTGVTTQKIYDHTRRQLGLKAVTHEMPAELMTLNETMPAFWSDHAGESGHVFIVPNGELHAKKTVPQHHEAAPGYLHRLWLRNI
jgi:hypothetical protein